MRRARLAKDSGFALIAVMAIGAVAMYSAVSLIGDGGVAERRQQEVELLKLRADWAAQGHMSFAISRARQGSACGGTRQDFAARKNGFDDYAEELETGGQRDWAYLDLGAGDVFPAAATAHPLISAEWPARRDFWAFICNGVAVDNDPCPGSQNDFDAASVVAHLVRMERR